jgi:hypothetical protein
MSVCLYISEALSPSSSASRSIKYYIKSPWPISRYFLIELQWPSNLNLENRIYIRDELVTSYALFTQLFSLEKVSEVEPERD